MKPIETIGAGAEGVNVRKSFFGKRATRLVAGAAAVAVAVTGLTLGGLPESAQAASYGPGGAWQSNNGDHLGAYRLPNGTLVYCIDANITYQDVDESGQIVNSIPAVSGGSRAVSGDDLKRINYAIHKWGQTNDNEMAAAVNAYIWGITSDEGKSAADYIGNGAPGGVFTKLNQVTSDTNANFNASGSSGAKADLVFTVDAKNNYVGTVKVSATDANATGTLTLTNGVFTDTGSNTRTGVKNGQVFNVRGVPPTEDGKTYKISGKVEFTGKSGFTYPAQVRLYDSPVTGFQRTAGFVAPTPFDENFSATAVDPGVGRSVKFSPQVETVVANKFLKRGQVYSDKLTFKLGTNADGTVNEWFKAKNGDYAPITAIGTLYGPSNIPFTEANQAPKGTPVAETNVKITTTAKDGPNIEYVASTKEKATEAGYYTWVWKIVGSDQPASVQNFLDGGSKYSFTDRFGQVKETHVTASNLIINTQASKPEAGIGEHIGDSVNVRLVDGSWIRDSNGDPIPAKLKGTAYYSKEKPVQSPEAPADAEKVGELDLEFTKAGQKESQPLRMPYKDGYVTFQWCVVEQDEAYFEPNCDDYGVPSETVKVTAPKVTTQAKPDAAPYEPFGDTAIVDGFVPENSSVSFETYKKVEAGDKKYKDGQPTEETWTQEEIDGLGDEAFCEASNLISTSKGVPVKEGQNDKAEYDSEKISVEQAGTYWWKEKLVTKHPDTGEEVLIHEGKCGIPNETTTVTPPKVVTEAKTEAPTHGDFFDTAIVDGRVPVKSEVKFTVFKKPVVGDMKWEDGKKTDVAWTQEEIDALGGKATCEAVNTVTTTKGIPVKAGKNDGEKYVSPNVSVDEKGTHWWVETLVTIDPKTDEEVVLHEGECGLTNETTEVVDPKVTTKATDKAVVGDKIFDTAIVDGPLAEKEGVSYDVTFEAYHRKTGTTTKPNEALCTPQTKVWESKEGVKVTGVGEYKSGEFKVEDKHTGEILWVETLWTTVDGERTATHRGECGAANEITKVSPKPAFVNSGVLPIYASVGFGVILLAGAAVLIARKRQAAKA